MISSNTITAFLTLNAHFIGGVTNNDTAYWSHQINHGEISIGFDQPIRRRPLQRVSYRRPAQSGNQWSKLQNRQDPRH